MSFPVTANHEVLRQITFTDRYLLTLLKADYSSIREMDISYEDQEVLIELIQRHRLNLSLSNTLPILKKKLVAQVFEKLQARIKRRTMRQLAAAKTFFAILHKFSKRNIEILPLKGPVLAQWLYNNFAGREYIDLDILIHPKHFEVAYQTLRELGYRAHSEVDLEHLSSKQIVAFMRISGDLPFEHVDGVSIRVELHWQPFSPTTLFPYSFGDIYSRSRVVETNGIEIPTLALEDNLLYLCIHGAKHQWFRMQWLNDIKHILTNHGEEIVWVEFIDECKHHGVHRPVAQALILCNLFFATPLPSVINKLFENDPKIGILVDRAIHAIFGQESLIDGLDQSSVHLITKNLMDLKPGVRYKWACISRLLLSPKDWSVLKLPEVLFPLYYPLRPFIYLIRRLRPGA